MTKIITPETFIDRLVKFNELGQPFSLRDHQREVLRLAFDFDQDGRLPWDTILYSCIKKSGKTTLNGAITLGWAFTQEAPNEILILANDLEQTLARVFRTMEGIIKHNPDLQREAEVQSKSIYLANGTVITAISGDYAGAAGSNHGFVSYDELWAYVSESSRRLWEELTPVSTRKNSIRFITTYAGFEGESELLMDLYKQVVDKDEHPEGQGERLHPDLPIYANRKARIFAYWDHEPRMPWQTEAYYESQKKTLRPGTYLRLHENRWTNSHGAFITADQWDAIIDPSLSPALNRTSVFLGIDLGVKSDSSAVVAVGWDQAGEKLVTRFHKIWKPTKGQNVNLDEVETHIQEISKLHYIHGILADPSQCYLLIQQLQQLGITVTEFPQTQSNGVRMGETLFSLIRDGNLIAYKAPDLREHVLNAVGIETPSGIRMVKGKSSKKIDAAIALAMACVAAVQQPGTFKIEDLQLLGAHRLSRHSKMWDEADEGGSSIARWFDSPRSRWDW